MSIFRNQFLLLFLFISVWACSNDSSGSSEKQPSEEKPDLSSADVLRLYTTQQLSDDDTLYQIFRQQTGITVAVTEVAAGQLIQELKTGKAIDVVIFPEIGMTVDAQAADLLQPYHPKLDNYHKSMARDDYGFWTGLSRKYPCIAYANERLKPDGLTDFWGLAEARWKGKIALPPSDDPYLISLLASMIVHNGEDMATEWADQLVKNAAAEVKADAKDRLKILAAGGAELTIVTAGDLGLMRFPPTYEELLVGQACSIIVPSNGDFHTHVNLNCATVPVQGNLQNAVAFIEFLCSQPAQQIYAGARHEFPANVMALPPDFIIEEMGGVREDELSFQALVNHRQQARQILQKVAWPTAN